MGGPFKTGAITDLPAKAQCAPRIRQLYTLGRTETELHIHATHSDCARVLRTRFAGVHAQPPTWDKMIVYTLAVMWLAWLTLMGADVARYHWSPDVPFAVHLGGLFIMAAGMWATTGGSLFSLFFPFSFLSPSSCGSYACVSGHRRSLLLLVFIGPWQLIHYCCVYTDS